MPARKGSRTGNKAGGKAIKSAYRGAAGRERMEEAWAQQEAAKEARKAAGVMPFRFYCPVGEEREVVIVDEEPDFFRNEHQMKNPATGRFDLFLPCVDDVSNCPVCAASDKPAYFAAYLTVIDLTPYTTRDDREIEWSKKLLVIKPAQQKKFMRLLSQHGTLRGMVLNMIRDGEKDASIGNDFEFLEFLEEDDLREFETVYEDRDGQEHEIIGHEPFDYEQLFPDMTESQLEKIVGVSGGSVGNRRTDDRDIGRVRSARNRRDAGDDDDDQPASRRSPKTRGKASTSRPSARKGSRVDPDDDDGPAFDPDDPDDGADDDAPASRRGPRAASRRGHKGEPEPEPSRKRGAGTAASRRAGIRGARR